VTRIVCIGEAMLELSRPKGLGAGGVWNMSYGGDTLNTAVHLARAGHDVAYLTAMGSDPFSDNLVNVEWRGEGLDTSLVLRDPARGPGLYAITTDDAGERSFTYWRDNSAARNMFALPGMGEALAKAEKADLLAYSLITLAILPPEAREQLFALCRRVRANGGKVAFDGNYRPRLWGNAEEARTARDAAIACADIGLPTLEDELALNSSPERGGGPAKLVEGQVQNILLTKTQENPPVPLHHPAAKALNGPPPRSGEDLVAHHWTNLGCPETIVKLGERGCRLPCGTIIPPPEVLNPIDTSGAGDAFNGGYLSARMNGVNVKEAALAGHRLAGWCVMRAGAIPARD
jgi:2-dehydro-3-deoxygluconokinase